MLISSVETIESDIVPVHTSSDIQIAGSEPKTNVATGGLNSVATSSPPSKFHQHQANAERMPISARTNKAKTTGNNTEKDHSMTFNDDGLNNFKKTAQFGSMQLGGTESPRQRGAQLETAIH